MRRFVLSTGFALLLSAVVAGCGGSSKTNNVVTQITATPSTLSINSGDVAQATFLTENSAGTPIAANTTFTSSNTNVATVSTAGAVCGGQWDSTFVVCTGVIGGVPVQGTATISATAAGITSPGITVTVHPRVSSVVLDPAIFPLAGCTSSAQTLQLPVSGVHVCSSQGTPDAAGLCSPTGRDISSVAGTPSFNSTDTSVVTIDATNLATAHNPGNSGIFANISGVSSPTTNFRTCMPKLLVLHLASDPAGTNTTVANMNPTQTLALKADMTDENGTGIGPAPVNIVSNNPVVASVSSTTLTAVNAGGAGIVAACVPPVCGNNTKTPIYSDVFQVTVTGSTPAATVYVTSSFIPPAGTAPVATPVNTGTGVASGPVGLSGAPNSMIFARGGVRAYLGTTGGLATLDPATNAEVTVDAGLVGAVIGVSPDGTVALVSNAANDPSTGTPIEPTPAKQRLFAFNQTTGQIQTLVVPGATSATFTPDGFKAYVTTNTGNFYVFSTAFSLLTKPIGVATQANVAFLGSDMFAYFSGGATLAPVSVCNDSAASPAVPATSAPQLVATISSSNQIVAVNSTGLDFITAAITPPTGVICPATVTYTNAPINFGIGAFTARQLLVAGNGSRVVVLPVGINKILTAALPAGTVTNITLPAGATEALSGALTNDGNTLWVSVGGTNSLDKIDLTAGTDVLQIVNTFKKSDGSPAPPNIVALQPK